MVRHYKRTYQSVRHGKHYKPYRSYSEESLQKAITAVQNKNLTLNVASQQFGVPVSTISRKARGLNNLQANSGHPTLFSKTEEDIFIKYIQEVSEWGFPFDLLDLRVLAQKYLARTGRNVPSLKNNMPGRDWAMNFMMRHRKNLSYRLTNNISSSRAEVNKETIDKFFDNFEAVCDSISPDRIINYDETNLTDDPGIKKFICKRGTKYPERIMDSTKSATSVMFAGAADGTLLEPYVVYKAEHLWDTWITGGPPGTHYNRSHSGWFDAVCFEDWFLKVVVSFAKKKEGVKILVGDNLSSHFSPRVLELCKTHNIKFVCLPAKSTHLMQPLDVAFYAPLKHHWRVILNEWKQKESRRIKTVRKDSFPPLFLKLYQKLNINGSGKQNIISGFDKCGLYPLNRNRPIERLPKTTQSVEEIDKNVSSTVIDMLNNLRTPQQQNQKKRKKRIQVSPGKSICIEDYQRSKENQSKQKVGKGKGKGKKTMAKENDQNTENTLPKEITEEPEKSLNKKTIKQNESLPEPKPSSSGIQQSKKVSRKRVMSCSSSSSDSSVEMSCHSNSDVDNYPSESSDSLRTLILKDSSDEEPEIVGASLAINDDVLLRYCQENDVKYYVARIEAIKENCVKVDCYQTLQSKFGLRFIKGKNRKVITVQRHLILKTIQLIETSTNVFILLDSTDKVYFLNK